MKLILALSSHRYDHKNVLHTIRGGSRNLFIVGAKMLKATPTLCCNHAHLIENEVSTNVIYQH